jgi:predicted ABC-type ATPase
MYYINGQKSIQTIIAQRLVDPNSLKRLDNYLRKQPQTKDIHSPAGCYTPARRTLHDRIIQEYISTSRCITRARPIAIMTGGLPGSGKSTFINRYADWINNPAIFKIDADEVRAKLPEYQGWNAAATHEETSDIVNRLIDIVGGSGCSYDVLYDGTMVNSRKYNALMDKLIIAGYDVYLIYIKIPLSVSIERALKRYQRSGRYVPLQIVRETASKGTTVFEELKRKATGWLEFDSINQIITETGGADLPSDRNYTTIAQIAGRLRRKTKLISGIKY